MQSSVEQFMVWSLISHISAFISLTSHLKGSLNFATWSISSWLGHLSPNWIRPLLSTFKVWEIANTGLDLLINVRTARMWEPGRIIIPLFCGHFLEGWGESLSSRAAARDETRGDETRQEEWSGVEWSEARPVDRQTDLMACHHHPHHPTFRPTFHTNRNLRSRPRFHIN